MQGTCGAEPPRSLSREDCRTACLLRDGEAHASACHVSATEPRRCNLQQLLDRISGPACIAPVSRRELSIYLRRCLASRNPDRTRDPLTRHDFQWRYRTAERVFGFDLCAWGPSGLVNWSETILRIDLKWVWQFSATGDSSAKSRCWSA